MLIAELPQGVRKTQITELRDNNMLILDLRDSSEADLVDIIVNEMPAYVSSTFDPDTAKALAPGFDELSRLARSQCRRNTEEVNRPIE
jgi:hypothetical protein